jgi:hypothetical protein
MLFLPNREVKWWARFRLRCSSYGGQVALPYGAVACVERLR